MKNSKTQNKSLHFLYCTVLGRGILRLLSARFISKLCGKFLDSAFSKPLIKGFVKNNNIDLSQFYSDKFNSFNDCFSRKIKSGLRPIAEGENALIAPCDGLLSAYRIKAESIIPVKQSAYTVSSLLRDDALAKQYKDGICLVFRLCVNHYHRYCYPVKGKKGENIFIKGVLHTVRPIALENRPVFTENCREYTVIDTENFGKVLQMEVGAMLVGKIFNYHGVKEVEKGEEKGKFLYGGSTVILLIEKDKVEIDSRFFEAAKNGKEIPVVMGEELCKTFVKIS